MSAPMVRGQCCFLSGHVRIGDANCAWNYTEP
jgi:hypothetical protein